MDITKWLLRMCLCLVGYFLNEGSSRHTFASLSYLKQLVDFESELCDFLYGYLAKVPEDLTRRQWKSHIPDIRQKHQDAAERDWYFMNPINIFDISWRLEKIWRPLLYHINKTSEVAGYLKCHNHNEIVKKAESYFQNSELFLNQASYCLAVLVNTYNLSIPEFIEGKFYDIQTNPLTDEQIMHVADVSLAKLANVAAEHWFSVAENQRLSVWQSPRKALRAALGWIESMKQANEYSNILDYLNELLQEYYYSRNMHLAYNYYVSHLDGTIAYDSTWSAQSHYQALCQGRTANVRPNSLSSVRCHVRYSQEIPFFPVKIEILQKKPPVCVFHDVIDDNTIKKILKSAKQKIGVARVEDKVIQSDDDISTAFRINGKKSWIKILSHRIEVITGLKTTKSNIRTATEPLQVVHYDVGGLHDPHFDFFADEQFRSHPRYPGNRIATVKMYLNDVTHGGYTVFPEWDIFVPPIKGSAVFFYNLKRNGLMDTNAGNAECPVLYGEKWVANKWIHEKGQEFNRRCATDKDL